MEINIKNIIPRLDAFINQKMIFHIAMYFLLVFVLPFCYRIAWLYFETEDRGLVLSDLLIYLMIRNSINVFISDIIQLTLWFLLNKIFEYPMRKIIIIYIYNKLLLPVTGFWALYNANILYSVYNMVYMLIFTLICFCLFRTSKKYLKLLCVILIFLMMITSFAYVYQYFI